MMENAPKRLKAPIYYLFRTVLPVLLIAVCQDPGQIARASEVIVDVKGEAKSSPQQHRTIPEIAELKDGEIIPQGVFTKYNSRQIGEGIVQRLETAKFSSYERQVDDA